MHYMHGNYQHFIRLTLCLKQNIKVSLLTFIVTVWLPKHILLQQQSTKIVNVYELNGLVRLTLE